MLMDDCDDEGRGCGDEDDGKKKTDDGDKEEDEKMAAATVAVTNDALATSSRDPKRC